MPTAHRAAPALTPPPTRAQDSAATYAVAAKQPTSKVPRPLSAPAPRTPAPRSLLRTASEAAFAASEAAAAEEQETVKVAKRKPPTKQALLKQELGRSIGQFTRHFRRWDTDGSGCIDRNEFRTALRTMKLSNADDEEACLLLFQEIDFDGSGTITNYECLRYALLDLVQRELDKVYTLCLLWDHDRSKTINRDEFCRIMEALKLEAPKAIIIQLFNELDEDKTGEIAYEDFTRRLRGAPPGQMARQLAEDAAPAPPRTMASSRLRKATNAARVVSPRFGLAASQRSSSRLPIDDKAFCNSP